MQNELTTTAAETSDVFGSLENFTAAVKMAEVLSTSTLVPDTYKGAPNVGNCLIALEMSRRLGANPLMVMQNLYIVHGKPAWSSQFLISCVNASRRFSPLRYEVSGEAGSDGYGCVAWAVDRDGQRLESPRVTLGMAKREGWVSKNGSKWQTMPELMLRYRAATFFARLFAPDLTMGIHTDDEENDIAAIETPAETPKQAQEATQSAIERLRDKLLPQTEPPAETQKESKKEAVAEESGELAELFRRVIAERHAPITLDDVRKHLVATRRLGEDCPLSGKALSDDFRKWVFADGNAARFVDEVVMVVQAL